MSGSLWIVIVNYRTADLAIDCVQSIAGQVADLPDVRTVVVDNASGDGSPEKLRKAIADNGWQEWASVLPLNRNGGFAFGNNAGIRIALQSTPRADHVLLLNPDTIAHPGAIRALVDFMHAHPKAGIAGSFQENANGIAQNPAHNAHSPLGQLESSARLGVLSRMLKRHVVTPPIRGAAHECDWISGASLIARREVFEQIGLMDEGYFLYFEEADFCTRARKVGWQVWFAPESRIIHLEGASTGIGNIARRRPAYWFDSRRRYFVKHFGIAGLILADILWSAGRATLGLRRALGLGTGGGQQDPVRFGLDLIWGDLKALLTGKLPEAHRKDVPL